MDYMVQITPWTGLVLSIDDFVNLFNVGSGLIDL
jgi:hypothetical protein